MDVSALGVRTLGIWTREQALAVLSSAAVDHLVRCGSWQVVWPGVYADGGYALDPPQRAFAAVMASGGADQPVPYGDPDPDTGKRRARLRAVAAGRTAARVWGFPLIDDDDPATGAHEHELEDVVWWRHARTVRCSGRELRRHDVRLAAGDVVRLPNSLWITTPVRTLVDCARLLAHEALVCAVDDALHREVVALRALQAADSDRGGMPGIRALRRAVTLADGRAEAPSETLARLVLLPVLPGLVPQVELFDAAMRLVARFDLGATRRYGSPSRPTAGRAMPANPWLRKINAAIAVPARWAGRPSAPRGSSCGGSRTGCASACWRPTAPCGVRRRHSPHRHLPATRRACRRSTAVRRSGGAAARRPRPRPRARARGCWRGRSGAGRWR